MRPLEAAVDVFIENPAGSDTKIHHDEVALVATFEEKVSAPYPYAYGFLPGVLSGDGDCLDCFVLSDRPLSTGETVACHPVALLEQYQNEMVDHDVVAVPVQEVGRLDELDLDEAIATIVSFIDVVFAHDPERVLRVGEARDAAAATAFIEQGREAATAHTTGEPDATVRS